MAHGKRANKSGRRAAEAPAPPMTHTTQLHTALVKALSPQIAACVVNFMRASGTSLGDVLVCVHEDRAGQLALCHREAAPEGFPQIGQWAEVLAAPAPHGRFRIFVAGPDPGTLTQASLAPGKGRMSM